MKFYCSRNILTEAISTVSRAIASRNTISILSGILFEVDNNIKLSGYDMEQSIEYTMPAEIKERGKVVIDASFLGDIIRKCPEETIYFEVDEKQNIEIHCGKAFFQVKGHSAEAYPKLPEVEGDKSLTIDGKELKKLLKLTVFAISIDQTRKNLMGSFFNIKSDHIDIVGIDGYRLALRRYQNEDNNFTEGSFIVPGKHVKDLVNIINDDEKVNVKFNERQIVFELANIKIISRLIQEEFVKYDAIIPNQYKSTIKVKTKELLDAMERSILISVAERSYPVTIMCDDNVMKIMVSSNRGKMLEEIDVEIEGEKINMDFNPRYFIDALKNIEDEEIYIRVSGMMSPCLLTGIDHENFMYIILPLRK